MKVLDWWEARSAQRLASKSDGLPQILWRGTYEHQLDEIALLTAHGYEPARYYDELIRDAASRALSRLGDFTPLRLEAPITLDVTFKSYTPAEIASYLEGVERVDAHTIRYVGTDMVEISRFLQFLGGYSASLVP